VAGPGTIVRTWTAKISGKLRVYLDDIDKPLYAGPAQDFLLHPYDTFINEAELGSVVLDGTFYQRNAAYCPMPFEKRCRIVWIGNVKNIHFYEVQIRKYAAGTKVKTFSPAELKAAGQQVSKVANVLRNPQKRWPYASKQEPVEISADLGPHKLDQVLSLEGPGAIERLTLKLNAEDLDLALRQTILRIRCDGSRWGQVESPLGDFFGSAPGINPWNSVPFTVESDGTMTCRYVMPFADSMKIEIYNRSKQAVQIRGSALPVDYEWNDKTSMHFYARWRITHDLKPSGNDVRDMPYVLASGRGVYVGTALMLLNPNPIPSPYGSWWGEGDEKIFVDDDMQPSTFGTGSEDYFNYSWSSSDIFLHPYCAQPRNDGPANRGFVTNCRWHILDPLPFQKRINFYMELYPHEWTPNISYARIGYFYGQPGLTDDHEPITMENLRHLKLPANWKPAARKGAGGAVFHEAETLVGKPDKVSTIQNRLWTRNELMVWHPKQVGETLTLELPIERSGKQAIRLIIARTPTSGKVSFTLDGPLRGGRPPFDVGGDRGSD